MLSQIEQLLVQISHSRLLCDFSKSSPVLFSDYFKNATISLNLDLFDIYNYNLS